MERDIIVDIDFDGKNLIVSRDPENTELYDLSIDGKVVQPGHTAEGIIAAMGNYLHNLSYQKNKPK